MAKKNKQDKQACVHGLVRRGYSQSRAQEICSKGMVKTMASDVKKVAKKAVAKVSSKLKK